MTIYTNNILQSYIDNNFSPIPVPLGCKIPVIKGWPDLVVTGENVNQHFNGEPTNIGILTGLPSGNLVDVDIDDPGALRFAECFLPKTDCIFGRQSNPR